MTAMLLVAGPGRALDASLAALLVGVLVVFVVVSFRRTGVEVRRVGSDAVTIRLRLGPIVLWRRGSSFEMLLIEVDQRAGSSRLTRVRWPGMYALVITGVDQRRTWRKSLVPEYWDYLRSVDATTCVRRAQGLVSSLSIPD